MKSEDLDQQLNRVYGGAKVYSVPFAIPLGVQLIADGESIGTVAEILKEDEICLIEAEFEAMLIAIRSKAEPTGLLFDVIQRSDEEMQELISH